MYILILLMYISLLLEAKRYNTINDLIGPSPVEIVDLVLRERMKQNKLFYLHRRSLEMTPKNYLKINDSDTVPGTKEPLLDGTRQILLKTTIQDSTSLPIDVPKGSIYLWTQQPSSSDLQDNGDFVLYPTKYKASYSVTRLVKTHNSGFEPYFYRGHFEPFERRPKPVTLVAFRKNGFMPRSRILKLESESTNIAELQSPYNDISSFWQDELTV